MDFIPDAVIHSHWLSCFPNYLLAYCWSAEISRWAQWIIEIVVLSCFHWAMIKLSKFPTLASMSGTLQLHMLWRRRKKLQVMRGWSFPKVCTALPLLPLVPFWTHVTKLGALTWQETRELTNHMLPPWCAYCIANFIWNSEPRLLHVPKALRCQNPSKRKSVPELQDPLWL